MSNKTQIQIHAQANGDIVPQISIVKQFRQSINEQEDVPLKTRLPQSQINQNLSQEQRINDIQRQPFQQPLSQNLVLQQRQDQYEMIQQKKQLDRVNDAYEENQPIENREIQREDGWEILLAPLKPYSRKPQILKCEKCQHIMISKVESKPGWGSCFCCFLMFLTPIFFLFLLPFFLESCKDAHHYCQSCSNKIGTYYFICE